MDEVVNDAETSVWTRENLAKYLSIYYSDQVEWADQLTKLQGRIKDSDRRRKQAAYTILAPYLHRVKATTPVEALLFACFKFSDYDEIDWVRELEVTFEQDKHTKALQSRLLSMGYIHPLEHDARCNQALRWLCEQASRQDDIVTAPAAVKAGVTNKYKNLIYVYGPSSICSLFQRPELKQSLLHNVHNWKTSYFIEKELLKANNDQQLMDRKELDLRRTQKDLVTQA